LAEDVKVDGKKVAKAGDQLTDEIAEVVVDSGVLEVRVRSVTSCEAEVGVCAARYGRSLASGRLVDIGEAVGIIAAQSIGEPGTQLTMRRSRVVSQVGHHPRSATRQELFEARKPGRRDHGAGWRGRSTMTREARSAYPATSEDDDMVRSTAVPARLTVVTGTVSRSGAADRGSVNPHEIPCVKGVRAAAAPRRRGAAGVPPAGVTIHDKHIS
jgi:DNA-directed RNA polymerase subunit beta'